MCSGEQAARRVLLKVAATSILSAVVSSEPPPPSDTTAELVKMTRGERVARGGPKPPPPPPAPFTGKLHFHLGFDVNGSGLYGCCADINHVGEYMGVKHLFRQSGNPKGDLGWEHHISTDWVHWHQLPTVLQPGAADGSLSVLDNGPVIMW
eukprot:COSAG02_NODE_88_length_38629_cov_457.967999_4_plen_151_part_00